MFVNSGIDRVKGLKKLQGRENRFTYIPHDVSDNKPMSMFKLPTIKN